VFSRGELIALSLSKVSKDGCGLEIIVGAFLIVIWSKFLLPGSPVFSALFSS
jgi:hypothetical protein